MTQSKYTRIMQVICSLFFAASLTFERHSTYNGSVWNVYPENFPLPLQLFDVAIFFLLAAAGFFILELLKRGLEKLLSKQDRAKKSDLPESPITAAKITKRTKIVAAVAFFAALICWMVVFLNYYPGTSMNDQIIIIDNPIALSNNHPIFYNLSLAGSVFIGEVLLGSASAGLALFVITQMIICAAIISFCAGWLSHRNCHPAVIGIFIAFFALCPVISNYAISSLKDTLFAYCLLLWVPFFAEAACDPRTFWKKRSSYVFLFALLAATILVRNNGLYIAIVLAVVVVIAYRHTHFKRIALTSVIALAVAMAPNIALSALGQQQLFRESVAIPLQQVAAVGAIDPESLAAEQTEFLDQLLPLEECRLHYAPMNVDEFKYAANFDTEFLQEHQKEFMQHYLQIGLAHPGIYTQAYLAETYGYWSLVAPNDSQSFFFELSDNVKLLDSEAIIQSHGLYNDSLYPNDFAQAFDGFYRSIMVFPGSGFNFFLVLLIGFVLSILKPSAKWLLVILPSVLVWGTIMISAPVSSALRYTFPLVVAIPLLICMLAPTKSNGY